VQAPAPKPPPGVIFDTAMDRIGHALALALLFGLESKGEVRLLSVSVSRPSLKAAQFCDVFGRFYGGFRFPVGLATGAGATAADPPMIDAVLDRRGEDGSPVYPRTIQKFTDTALVPSVARNALTAQHDGNAIVILAGPATDLARWLDLGPKDVIAAKVRRLVIAASEGELPTDAAATKKVLAEWPTEVVVTPEQLGSTLRFPASAIEKEFSWAPNHPLVDAWKATERGSEDAPATAMAAALYAARPDAGLFKVSESGGPHRQLAADPSQQARVVEAFVELASAKPNRPRPRRGGQ
jgi:hypothetical protein